MISCFGVKTSHPHSIRRLRNIHIKISCHVLLLLKTKICKKMRFERSPFSLTADGTEILQDLPIGVGCDSGTFFPESYVEMPGSKQLQLALLFAVSTSLIQP